MTVSIFFKKLSNASARPTQKKKFCPLSKCHREFESMKKFLLARTENIHRFRHKLVKRCGLWCMQKIGAEEWKTMKDQFVVLKTGIHTSEDLCNYLVDEQAIRGPVEGGMQCKFILIPDYKKHKSVVLFKVHHSLADGMGVAAAFLAIDGNYDTKHLPAPRPPSPLRGLFFFIFKPVFVMLGVLKVGFNQKKDVNALKRHRPLTYKRTTAFSKDLHLPSIKAKTKELGCTVNDYMTAVFSCTLYEYFATHQVVDGQKYDIPKHLRIVSAFSNR